MASVVNVADSHDPVAPRRKALKIAVGALCMEAGYTDAENIALETLCEMLQAYIAEVGRYSQSLAELSGRTEVMPTDILLSAMEMGMDVQSLPNYSKRHNKITLSPCLTTLPVVTARILQVGETRPLPSYIPDYLPPFPDPHTYIKTQTYRPSASEYQQIREKAASQKRDVERALTRFIAKTGETETLFQDDPYAFPLIADKPRSQPYMESLLPKDQEFGEEEDGQELMDRQKALQRTSPTKGVEVPEEGPEPALMDTSTEGTELQIDNPYLRPIKMPRLKGVRKSKYET